MTDVRYRHEVGGREQQHRDLSGHAARAEFVGAKAKARTAADRREQAAIQAQKKYMVKGRMLASGRKVWDVYRVQGLKKPMLLAQGFDWPEEAVAHVRDLDMGRISVGYGSVRGAFEKKGALLMPSKGIDLPGKTQGPKVQQLANGDIMVVTR